ncbi:MAG: hypothetical protein ACI8TE_001729 [Francisella sp.]
MYATLYQVYDGEIKEMSIAKCGNIYGQVIALQYVGTMPDGSVKYGFITSQALYSGFKIEPNGDINCVNEMKRRIYPTDRYSSVAGYKNHMLIEISSKGKSSVITLVE